MMRKPSDVHQGQWVFLFLFFFLCGGLGDWLVCWLYGQKGLGLNRELTKLHILRIDNDQEMGVPKSTVQKSWISNPAVSTVHMSVKLCWWRQFTGDTVHEEGLDQVGPWSGPLRVITQRIIEDNTPMSVCIYVHMI